MTDTGPDGKPAGGPATSPDAPVARQGRSRPWLAPVIAVGLAAVILGVMLVPGVLRFPAPPPAPDPALRVALEDGNRALEAEIARIRSTLAGGVCVHDGSLFPRAVEDVPGAPPAERALDLLPPQPAMSRPAPEARPPAVPGAAAFDGTMDELLKRSTVLVLNPTESSTGSAFFVAPRVLATNSHVVGKAETVLVTNDLIRAPLRARVAARTELPQEARPPVPDFALLILEEDAPSALPLSLAAPVRTQEVYASGYPGFFVGEEVDQYIRSVTSGQEATPPMGVVTSGIVTTVQKVREVGYVPHTAGISPGNSGGPLVDHCGRVVGINTFGRQSRGNEIMIQGDYALSATDLAAWLAANGQAPRVLAEACTPERVAAPAVAPAAGSATSTP